MAWRVLLILVCTLLLTACGPKRVRGEAPLVQVTSWSIEGTQLDMALRVRNVNDEEMPLAGVNFTVLLDEVDLVTYSGTHDVEIAANGSETLNLTMQATDAGTALLSELQAGERQSLPYDFSGQVNTLGGKNFRFNREGHIYQVPGRPGQFR